MKRLALLATVLSAALALSAVAPAAQPNKRPTDEVRGKELYARHCEACHGAYAGGHGPATEALVHPVPDLLGKVKANDEAIRIVLRGKSAMPGYEQTFDKHDARRVLQHMAKIKAPTADDAAVADDAAGPAAADDAHDPAVEEADGGEEDAQAPPSPDAE